MVEFVGVLSQLTLVHLKERLAGLAVVLLDNFSVLVVLDVIGPQLGHTCCCAVNFWLHDV
jgi:hypothetical protein